MHKTLSKLQKNTMSRTGQSNEVDKTCLDNILPYLEYSEMQTKLLEPFDETSKT